MNRLAAAIAALPLAAACSFSPQVSNGEVHAVVSWASTQPVKPGTTASLRLPPGLVGDQRMKWVQAAHLKDGRVCVLMVTSIGYKDNFEGVLGCSAALATREIVTPDDNRHPYVALPGYGTFEELYIADKRNDATYDVYFDLN